MNRAELLASRRGYFFLAAVVYLFDQASKIAIHAWLSPRGSVKLLPAGFDLAYSRNPGGLFGYLGDLADPWRSILLTGIPVLAVLMIVGFLLQNEAIDRATLTGLGLILGGALGNLTDRLFRGEVVDFLDVYVPSGGPADWLIQRFGTAHWPTFNIADSAIVCGAAVLILGIFRPQPATAIPSPRDADPD